MTNQQKLNCVPAAARSRAKQKTAVEVCNKSRLSSVAHLRKKTLIDWNSPLPSAEIRSPSFSHSPLAPTFQKVCVETHSSGGGGGGIASFTFVTSQRALVTSWMFVTTPTPRMLAPPSVQPPGFCLLPNC